MLGDRVYIASGRDMLSNNVDLYRVDLILLHKYDAIPKFSQRDARILKPVLRSDHPARFSFPIDHFVSWSLETLMTLEYIHVAKITHTQSGYWDAAKTWPG